MIEIYKVRRIVNQMSLIILTSNEPTMRCVNLFPDYSLASYVDLYFSTSTSKVVAAGATELLQSGLSLLTAA